MTATHVRDNDDGDGNDDNDDDHTMMMETMTTHITLRCRHDDSNDTPRHNTMTVVTMMTIMRTHI